MPEQAADEIHGYFEDRYEQAEALTAAVGILILAVWGAGESGVVEVEVPAAALALAVALITTAVGIDQRSD